MMDPVNTMRTWQFSVEANMGQARRWARVALSGLVAASLCLGASGLALAAGEGTDVLDWNVSGSIEAGGMYSFGERGSSKFNEYRDMDNGFVGDLTLRGEKKDSPYYFDLRAKNPARDDQLYGGEFGRYGLFRLDLGWDRTPHVLSNSAQTIFQESGSDFTIPVALRPFTTANAQARINSLTRSVELSFNTDVGRAGFKLTPTEELRFDLEYSNRRREGHRPLGTVIGSPGGSVTELAVPIDNMTHEVKFGAEFARSAYALQFNYTGSIFRNEFEGYSWDNPLVTTDTPTASSRGQISAPPDNLAHTFSLTGTAALPLRSRISGTFAYSLLRQDESFLVNVPNTAVLQTSADDTGKTSPDAKANLVNGNIQLTSRPFNSVTATARYRYFEYQNDTPFHMFSQSWPEGALGAQSHSTKQERFTKQNAGLDLGWRPIQQVAFKAGYEYEHWNRGDFEDQSFSNDEHIGKFAVDVTPMDWFLGRVTYTYGDRTVEGFDFDPATMLPQAIKYNYADRRRNRVDALLQFTPWETLTPSINFGYANDDFHNNQFGLLKDDYWTAGANLDWTPVKWLTISGGYTYEQYNYEMATRYLVGGVFPGIPANDWKSKSKDEFHNVDLNAVVTFVPKKFDVTLGYGVTFGFTSFRTTNLNFVGGTTQASATAYNWDRVSNILQTFRIIGKYRLTEKFSLRGGFAYERYTDRDFARDPMAPFMGGYEQAVPGGPPVNAGILSVYLGSTQPSYESYIFSAVARYDF